MDIYAKIKYNKPWELATVVNEAFQPTNDMPAAEAATGRLLINQNKECKAV